MFADLEIKWLGQSGFFIKSSSGKNIYIDPFRISKEFENEKADFIFITHSHYDHCSIEDIQKISRDGTVIICTADVPSKLRHINKKLDIRITQIGADMELLKGELKFWTVVAYNLNKSAHTREEDWIGYLIKIDKTLIYHAGDTDFIPEMKRINGVDIALLPIGGTYTMNAGEAAKAVAVIKPKLAVPMHWGTIVGDRKDAEIFVKHCSTEGIDARILEKS